MKIGNKLLLLATCIFVFASCNSNDDDFDSSLTRVKTQSIMEDDQMFFYSIYEYDVFGRAIKQTMVQGAGSNVFIVAYTENTIVGHVSGDDYPDPCVYYYYLNSKGLADSTICTGGDLVYYHIKTEYDADGYLIKEDCNSPAYGYHSVMENVIEKGNVARCIYNKTTFTPTVNVANILSEKLLKSFSEQAGFSRHDRLMKLQNKIGQSGSESQTQYCDTTYYEYSDHLNTIELNSMGFSFKGVQNKNIPTKETIHDGTSVTVYPYSYEFDSEGRVTKSTRGTSENAYYTYTDQDFYDVK